MKNQALVFKLVSVQAVHYTTDDETVVNNFLLKWVTGEYIKNETELAGFKSTNMGKQITYYMYVPQLKEGITVGKQKGTEETIIEHYYQGAGVWLPVNFRVITEEGKGKFEGYEFKKLVSL